MTAAPVPSAAEPPLGGLMRGSKADSAEALTTRRDRREAIGQDLVVRRCGVLSVALAAALAVGCGRSDGSDADREPDDTGPGWTLGGNVGERFGPFPFDATMVGADADQWVVVALPEGDPIQAFHELVDEVRRDGVTVLMADGGACSQAWSREEAPFGAEADGFEFAGETPFGEELPDGATVEGIACEVVADHPDGPVGITTHVSMRPGTPEFPNRSAILLSSIGTPALEAEFRRQDIDVQVTAPPDAAPTDHELDVAGLAVRAPLAPSGALFLPHADGGGCYAALLRSPSPPTPAVSEAIAQTAYTEDFEGQPAQATIGDREVATHRAIILAGGPLVSIAAVETESGSDVLVCSRQS